jgi:hypothetical protein
MKKLINEFARMQKLAGLITENQEFNVNQAYEKSPNEQTYKDMLDVVKEFEDEKYLKSFISTFPQGKSINKKEWEKWSRSMEDYDPEGYTYLNWISVSDPSIYTKAGVIETTLKEDINSDIDDDLMNGGFEDEQGQIEYLQGIIEYCQMLIKQIQSESGLNENVNKSDLLSFVENNKSKIINSIMPGSDPDSDLVYLEKLRPGQLANMMSGFGEYQGKTIDVVEVSDDSKGKGIHIRFEPFSKEEFDEVTEKSGSGMINVAGKRLYYYTMDY